MILNGVEHHTVQSKSPFGYGTVVCVIDFPATHEGVLTEDTVSSENLAATFTEVAALTFFQKSAPAEQFPATVNKLNRNYPIPIDRSRAREVQCLSGCFNFNAPCVEISP